MPPIMGNDSINMGTPFMNNASGLILGGVANSIDNSDKTNVRGMFMREIYGNDERAKKQRQQ